MVHVKEDTVRHVAPTFALHVSTHMCWRRCEKIPEKKPADTELVAIPVADVAQFEAERRISDPGPATLANNTPLNDTNSLASTIDEVACACRLGAEFEFSEMFSAIGVRLALATAVRTDLDPESFPAMCGTRLTHVCSHVCLEPAEREGLSLQRKKA